MPLVRSLVTVGLGLAAVGGLASVAGDGPTAGRWSATASVSAAKATGGLTVNAAPPSSTLLPGEIATWTITTKATTPVWLTFSSEGLPSGATAGFTPTTALAGTAVKLEVATSSTTAPGSYPLTITATGAAARATATVTLVVTTSGKDFAISAPAVTVPGPGASVSLDLGLVNPNSQALSITNLTVTVASVTKAGTGVCTTSDYAVQQYSGSYPLVVGGRSSTSLSALSPSASWPRLVMVNTNTDQSGCKGAALRLALTGAGHG